MINFLIFFALIFSSAASLILSLHLSKQNNSIIYTPVLIFTILQVGMVNIGLLLMAIQYNTAELYEGAFLLMASTLAFTIGAFFAKQKTWYRYSSLVKNDTQLHYLIMVIGFLTTLMIVAMLSGDLISNFIGFFRNFIRGDVQEAINQLAQARKDYTFNNLGGAGILTQLKNTILIFFAIYIVTGRRSPLLKFFVISSSLFLLLSSGQRWPLFEALIVYAIYKSLVQPIKIKVKKTIWVALMIYLALFATSYVQPRYELTDSVFQNMLLNIEAVNFRVFTSQSQTSKYIFELIPSTLDYGAGKYTLQDIASYAPGYQEGFSGTLYRITHYGKIGSASFSTLTLFFADFGYGSILISMAYGYFIQLYTQHVISKRNLRITLIFHAFIFMAIATTALGSFTGILYHGLVSAFLLHILLKTIFSMTSFPHQAHRVY